LLFLQVSHDDLWKRRSQEGLLTSSVHYEV
jgi:hypothetical protein